MDTAVVELVYRPSRSDIVIGIRVRDRVRKAALVRGAFAVVFTLLVLGGVLAGVGVLSLVLWAVCGAVLWFMPYLQANHVFRTVSWQGEYRSVVGAEGITARTEHATLTQRWSAFRGHRETRDHFVLLSRDPNILVIEALPKRGLGSEADVSRLRELLAAKLPSL
ncbi:YcxB family protein [Streptomyces sp. NPDC057877]|uniref:YcxB family protein n=1 Tax=Streptomyces sp. NPDC057877 TaxID=3346269 RepID=UPI0036AA4886